MIEDRLALATDGFVGITVDLSRFENPSRKDDVLGLLAQLGEPVKMGDVLIYRLSGADIGVKE